MTTFGFDKSQRLKSSQAIDELFHSGKRLKKFPLLLIFQAADHQDHLKVAVSVPKRKFKRAVDRNLLKRRIKECYRLQKASVYDKAKSADVHYNLLFIYTASSKEPYATIEQSMAHLLTTFDKRIGEHN